MTRPPWWYWPAAILAVLPGVLCWWALIAWLK
jgi:hypothetical protein